MGNVSMRVEAYKGYENKEGSKTQGSSSLASFCPVIKKKESNVGVGGKDSTDAKEKKSENVESKCPVKKGSTVFNVYSQPIDPTNNMPANPNQLPRQGQRRPIDTSRVKSSIPKGGTDEDTWTYPSPQMFYNALNRKGKGEGVDEEKEQQNLPTWWIESPFLHTSIGGIDKQRKADLLQDARRSASYISAARINGVQWTSDMILDFHTACAAALKCYPYEEKNKYRLSIAKSVGPENARVQLYRQASEIAVEDCVGNRSGVSSSFGMDVNVFMVGLSYFLNIPTKVAINIVRSSCAAKTRNLLLASCSALRKEREGISSPSADLLLSLFSIVSVLNVFPFTENSAEIEMINEGFKTRVTEKERTELLEAYKQISDGVGDRTIEEALR